MYGSPISSLPAQMMSWITAGTPSGAAATPSMKRAVVPGTSSSGRNVGPVALVMPSPIVSSLGMLAVRLLAADSLEVGAMPPVLGAAVSLVEVLLAAVPVVVLA